MNRILYLLCVMLLVAGCGSSDGQDESNGPGKKQVERTEQTPKSSHKVDRIDEKVAGQILTKTRHAVAAEPEKVECTPQMEDLCPDAIVRGRYGKITTTSLVLYPDAATAEKAHAEALKSGSVAGPFQINRAHACNVFVTAQQPIDDKDLASFKSVVAEINKRCK